MITPSRFDDNWGAATGLRDACASRLISHFRQSMMIPQMRAFRFGPGSPIHHTYSNTWIDETRNAIHEYRHLTHAEESSWAQEQGFESSSEFTT